MNRFKAASGSRKRTDGEESSNQYTPRRDARPQGRVSNDLSMGRKTGDVDWIIGIHGAGDGIRTHDIQLGKLTLYP